MVLIHTDDKICIYRKVIIGNGWCDAGCMLKNRDLGSTVEGVKHCLNCPDRKIKKEVKDL